MVGSSPATGTMFLLGVAQPGSASALGAEGREFDPLHRDQLGNENEAIDRNCGEGLGS